ncbi:MAG TPA: TadE/TadG family type IV pilus assembly protein [Candidatus Sulfotelmatobacter sp.]|nr:TadE/TadG family type IV pilus assembly protein [Candidatus Sulfotelmatobacter sp.]
MKVKVAFEWLVVETRGAEIAEAAAVLPLMFMILLGIFWFGQAFSIYGAITRAAQEGARAGSVPYCATCNGDNSLTAYGTNAATAVKNALTSSNLDPTLAQYPSPQPSLISCSSGTAVSCNGTASSNFCIQAPIQLTNTGLGATGLCGISVSLQYPYRFWLPFTSINKQTIWITAESRVRMETR